MWFDENAAIKNMIRHIYRYFKWIMFRCRFPLIRVNYGSFKSSSFSCDSGAIIERGVQLGNVRLGDGTIIRSVATLNNVSCAEHVVINSGSTVDDAEIGRYSYVGPMGKFSKVKIGAFCSIGAECICGSGGHPIDYISTHPVFFSLGRQCGVTFASEALFEERGKILIGNDVWIGARVFIRDGVSIGSGAVIAAGAVVVSDIPPYAIAGGVPARVIKYRFGEKEVDKLLALKWWEWDEIDLRKAQKEIASNNVQSFLNSHTKREVE